jgi:macrolide-specific efflux system membrane fusion protein
MIKYIVFALILGALAYIFYTFYQKPAESVSQVIPPVVVGKAQRGDLPLSISTYAYIEGRNIVPVVPLVNGEIEEHKVNVGDYLFVGDEISVIDSELYRVQKESAQSAYQVASSSFDRITNLYQAKAVSTQVYEEAKGQMEIAKGQLDIANTQLAYTRILSPIEGTVIMNPGSVGQMAQVGHPVAVIADLTDLVINISLPTTYWDIIHTHKDQLHIQIMKDDGSPVETTLEHISPIIDPESATFTVTCAVDNSALLFTPGLYVEVSIIYETYKNVLTLSHQYVPSDNTLYLYDEQSKKVKKVTIEKGVENDEYILLNDSFEDKWIVLEGSSMIADGQQVNAQMKKGNL